MHACMHTYIHTYIHTYTHIMLRTYTHTYIHTYTHTYDQFKVQSLTCNTRGTDNFVRACTINQYSCMHTYIHTYIHIQGQKHPLNWAREVVAFLLGMPNRADWKNCAASK